MVLISIRRSHGNILKWSVNGLYKYQKIEIFRNGLANGECRSCEHSKLMFSFSLLVVIASMIYTQMLTKPFLLTFEYLNTAGRIRSSEC